MAGYVLTVWRSVGSDFVRVGDIVAEVKGTGGRGAFRYAASYLYRPDAAPVDPISLPLQAAPFTLPNSLIHGVFEDSLPDAWGRKLMISRHNLPRPHQNLPRLLGLLGSSGLGALAYSTSSKPPAPYPEEASLLQLERLVEAAERFELGEEDDSEITALLGAGSSPGGARPKAVVYDAAAGEHYIAKFPSSKDTFDVVCIEAATMSLAAKAGLEVPPTRLVPCGGKQVLLVSRFDLTPYGRRHMVSFQTLLRATGAYVNRYSDLLGIIRKISADPEEDSVRFFRQACFNSAIDNTDDHLKNFWMVHDHQDGWRLSPAFDLNPDIGQNAGQHVLFFGDSQCSPSKEKLVRLGRDWGISKPETVVNEVFGAVAGWKEEFAAFGVPEKDIMRLRHLDLTI
jgi:serine/threonine-protein kinase HipA